MTIVDPISDLFTRIRNSLKEKHESVMVPYSKNKFIILKILESHGFIKNFYIQDESLVQKYIKINLKYNKSGKQVISELKRVSKSSKRVYVKKCEIPKVLSGFGLSIVSTSKGIMSGKDARLKNVGGELMGIIW
jgi:small subunit ribosomal protein S8